MLDRPHGEKRHDIRVARPATVYPRPARPASSNEPDKVSLDPLAQSDHYRLVVPYAPDPRNLNEAMPGSARP